jgi:hypothetical protein
VLLTLFFIAWAQQLLGSDNLQSKKHNGLSAREQSQIAAVIGSDDWAYHAVQLSHGIRMDNATHRLSAEFTKTGVNFYQEGYRWGLALHGYGYGDALRTANAVSPNSNTNRVEYRRGDVTEWYVNGPLGLEQGFTLRHAPGATKNGPLTLAFALSGGLTASVDPDGRSLTLKNGDVAALQYSGLTAYDARGRELRSWLEVAGNQLRIRVDDAGAQYPLTIDPYVQGVRLTMAKPCYFGGVCDDGGPYDYFGWSVAMSADGNTVVVGGVREKAYVFLKTPDINGGWNSYTPIYYAAKLVPSDPVANSNFGQSVAVNSNGSTIVVGAPFTWGSTYTGAVYVFLKPAGGWSPSTPVYQTAKLKAFNQQPGNQLGASVAISADGNTVAAGGPTAKIYRDPQGMAYVFTKWASGWNNSYQQATLYLENNWRPYDHLGSSVSISADGQIVVVGAPYNAGADVGAAYVFRDIRGDWTVWVMDAKLLPSDNNPRKFGGSVSISADASTIAVGASSCLLGGCGLYPGGPGSLYVYSRNGDSWYAYPPSRTENAILTASDATSNDYLGASLAITGSGSVVFAAAPNVQNQGSTYAFVRSATGWTNSTEATKFTAAEGPMSVSANSDGTAVVIGSPFATIGSNPREGAAYVFTGTAAAPTASVSPTSLTFGSQAIGTTSSPKTVTVANTGTGPLHVTGVAAAGPFTSTQNCVAASPIAPGSSCSENVSFAPVSAGAQTGTLTFTDNSGSVNGATQQVQLQGNGVKSTTNTGITSVTFNPALVGEPVTVAFSVSSLSGTTLTPSGTVTVKASTGESCTGNAPSGSCAISFSTGADRTVSATYNGDSNFSSSVSSPVSVRIVNFTLSVSPSSQTIMGKKATYTLTVAPENGFTGTVSLNCGGGPANTTCVMSPGSVILSGSAATAKATFTLPNTSTTGTFTLTFSGQFGTVTRSITASLTVN